VIDDGLPEGLEVARDVSAADWLTARFLPWPTPDKHILAASFVPDGYESYASVRHEGGVDFDLSDRDTQALVAVLTDFTASADECWFCLWTGYGSIDLLGTGPAIVHVQGREYVLLRGPLAAVVGFSWERPKLWWPSDRSWCVGGDIDLARTFVGGPEDTIDALAATEALDVEPISLDVRVDGTNDLPRLIHGN
jgi:hypothetical protein